MTNLVPLSEAFGPTLQGEGPHAGRPASFLRLGGCNLSCSWCDSAYTWDAQRYSLREEIALLSVEEVLERIPPARVLVITGGEPLLHQHTAGWRDLLVRLRECFAELHLETNGTLLPTEATIQALAHVSISPKLPNAGKHKRTQDPEMAPGWSRHPQAILKVVCTNALDVEIAVSLAARNGFEPDRLWVMPEGQTQDDLACRWPQVASEAARLGVNATHRLHVLAWGPERGH